VKPLRKNLPPGRQAALEARDAMFTAIIDERFGSGGVRILSTSDVAGGNNSLSLRRRDLLGDGRRFSVIEKMPSIAPRERLELNARELWLYARYFRDHRTRFGPELYGSRQEGDLIQLVFEYIEGTRPNLRAAPVRARVLEALAEVGGTPVPDAIPFERWALPFMSTERILHRTALLAPELDLEPFRSRVPLHAARYGEMKGGLGHGDLHRGNILLDRHRKVFLLDWSRWGVHPLGSDYGKYLLGAAYRSEPLLVREELRGYAAAVGADLDDVVFSARYTRIGFLLGMVTRKGGHPNRGALTEEILHHVAGLESGQ
jgi:hypothetical protein